jgi:hypothetical protein
VAKKEKRMRPQLWQPPVALSPEETAIVKRIRRAKLFIFLREQRQVLSSPDFQAELGALLYEEAAKGRPPIPPAQLALATILQAYQGYSMQHTPMRNGAHDDLRTGNVETCFLVTGSLGPVRGLSRNEAIAPA